MAPYSQLSRSGRREADPVPESVAAGRPEPEYHEKGIGDGAASDLTIVRPTAAAALKAARAGQAIIHRAGFVGTPRQGIKSASRKVGERERRRVHADKHVDFSIDIAGDLAVACEEQDFDEMAGNLLDNAFQWTRRKVEVHAGVKDGNSVVVSIEDDGPGFDLEQVPQVLQPGQRLDERAPGFGFGLSITRELAELYGG